MDSERWGSLVNDSLQKLKEVDGQFRPTSFWGPGLTQLLADLESDGLRTFKQWSTANYWFYPTYGAGLNDAKIDAIHEFATTVQPSIPRHWMGSALNGMSEAGRDFDAVRLAWDQERWPFDLEGHGESTVGAPWQRYPLVPPTKVTFGRPYLNYLLCLAALSRHVDAPPRSFLELGGGFGVLGEIVMTRDPGARYVDVDLPPLFVVASAYLTELFPDRILAADVLPESGPVTVGASGCLPNWRLPDLQDDFEVFLNSYSFQEMEPDVVQRYVDLVARGPRPEYVVSLNSVAGKPKVADGNAIGVVDPVTSSRIIAMFEAHGYELCGTYRRPLIVSAGEIAVLRLRGSKPSSVGRGTLRKAARRVASALPR